MVGSLGSGDEGWGGGVGNSDGAKVLPGAKASTGARQQNRAASDIVAGVVERLRQSPVHRFVKCVQPVGPVQSDDPPCSSIVDQNRIHLLLRRSPKIA